MESQKGCGEQQREAWDSCSGKGAASRSCDEGQQMRMTAELEVAVRKWQQCSGQLRLENNDLRLDDYIGSKIFEDWMLWIRRLTGDVRDEINVVTAG